MKKIFIFAILLWSVVVFSLAEDRPSENDIFGGSSTSSTMSPTPTAAESKSTSKALFSEGTVQIGGTLSTEGDFFIQEKVPFLENTAINPNILFLYLDSKLENDARVFARLRTFYDPTGISGGTPGFSSLTNPYGFGTGTSDNLAISLQELRISANIAKKVFFTIGRQKVKYGAAHFFNPTDFLNPQPFNFFLPTDERTGVDMIKAQVPSGITNFYAAGIFGNPTTGSQSGGYFREEVGYNALAGDLLGGGEIAFSGYLPRYQPGKAGFDISQAVGDMDLYFEGAAGQGADGSWKDAVSAGFTWGFKYGDRDTNTINFEGEYSQAGNLAEYGVFGFQLGAPWGLNDVTFVETNLFNFMDQSGLSRLDTVCQFSERISGRVYVSGHWGDKGGTLYLPGQVAETGTRLDVNF